jgi:hypothetical protein
VKRLALGIGLGAAIAYGWRRLRGVEDPEPQPSWQGTDNDPEDRVALDDDLLDRTRESAPADYEREPQP